MIKSIKAIPIYNSRGEKTIEIAVETENGVFRGKAPYGKSRGKWEPIILDTRKSLVAFNRIKRNLIGLEDFQEVDTALNDVGGENFSNIGGSLSIAISIACLRAFSKGKIYSFLSPKADQIPLPLGNVIGGGAHGGFTTIQEFLVIPTKAKTIEEAAEINFDVWRDVGKYLKLTGFSAGRNDEGAWITRLNEWKTLDLMADMAERNDVKIGIDVAASSFYKNGKYVYRNLGKNYDPGQQLEFMKDIIKTYKLAYVEDPFHESDFVSFKELRKTGCLIVGDDLTSTKPHRLELAIKKEAINGIIIKPDQAGTVSLAIQTANIASKNKITKIVSHRSGETSDTFISDLAVAVNASLIKCGIYGGERTAKINRLREIWSELNEPKMAKL